MLTLGRLCCIIEAAQMEASEPDEELARLAVPLLVDSLSGEASGSAAHVHACGVYVLGCLGVLYGNGHCRWAPSSSDSLQYFCSQFKQSLLALVHVHSEPFKPGCSGISTIHRHTWVHAQSWWL